MDEGLKIRISADTQQAEAGIKKVTQSLNNLKPGANQATTALTNLSRVAQDAPFGFIGIANNIEPLIGSFVALKKETGSTTGALTALASSLAGGGGLILGVGLVSAAMSVFGGSMFSAGKKSKEAADEIKSSFDIIGSSTASVQGDIAKVQALAGVITDTNRAYKERANALNQLKDVNKSYFGDLTLETAQLGALKTAVNEYSQAIIQQAIVKGFQDNISKISQEIFTQREALKKAGDEVVFYQNQLKKISEQNSQTPQGIASVNTQVVNAQTAFAAANKRYKEQADLLVNLSKDYYNLEQGIQDAISTQLKFKPLDSEKTKVEKEKIKKQIEEIRIAFSEIGGITNPNPSTTTLADTLKIGKIDVSFGDKIKKALAPVNAEFLLAQQNAKKTAETVVGILSPAFDTFFNTLIEGSGNPFKAFGDALKKLITQMVATIAKALILAAIMNAIAPGSGTFKSTFMNILGSGVGVNLGGGVANNFNAGGITGAARPGSQQLVTEIRGSSLALILKRNGNSNGI